MHSFARHCPAPHKSVIRMVGYCLALLDEPAIWQLAAIINARLSPTERGFLAVAALWSLDDDEYRRVVAFMECEE